MQALSIAIAMTTPVHPMLVNRFDKNSTIACSIACMQLVSCARVLILVSGPWRIVPDLRNDCQQHDLRGEGGLEGHSPSKNPASPRWAAEPLQRGEGCRGG